MSRPLRLEFPNALYHITSRGDRREDIYEDAIDRRAFLDMFSSVIVQFNWVCYAYCLMHNHYHLLVQTPDSNLSKGMRHLNGIFTQAYNRRHNKTGHLFQGRFKSILVEEDAYLLALSRYIVLNPVKAGMVKEKTGLCNKRIRGHSALAIHPVQRYGSRLLAGIEGKSRAKITGPNSPLNLEGNLPCL